MWVKPSTISVSNLALKIYKMILLNNILIIKKLDMQLPYLQKNTCQILYSTVLNRTISCTSWRGKIIMRTFLKLKPI